MHSSLLLFHTLLIHVHVMITTDAEDVEEEDEAGIISYLKVCAK